MFEAARQTIHANPALLSRCSPEDLKLLDEKLVHLAARNAIMQAHGWKKLRVSLSEVRSGRYQQFSRSWQSVMRDLFA